MAKSFKLLIVVMAMAGLSLSFLACGHQEIRPGQVIPVNSSDIAKNQHDPSAREAAAKVALIASGQVPSNCDKGVKFQLRLMPDVPCSGEYTQEIAKRHAQNAVIVSAGKSGANAVVIHGPKFSCQSRSLAATAYSCQTQE